MTINNFLTNPYDYVIKRHFTIWMTLSPHNVNCINNSKLQFRRPSVRYFRGIHMRNEGTLGVGVGVYNC